MKLSLNQATTRPYGLPETAAAAAAAGIEHIGLWLEPVQQIGTAATRALLRDTGLTPTSMCRVGFVADKQGTALREALDATRHALDVCAEVGAPYLTFIAGGLTANDRSISNAELRIADALGELVPHAQQTGVKLALEPIHPLFVHDRSVVTTVRQGLRVVEELAVEHVGLLIDAWATFWDPELESSLADAGSAGRLFGYQINDFTLPLPLPENMNGRVMPGEGTIDLPGLTHSMIEAGYRDPIEVEVFNEELWRLPLEVIVARTVESFGYAIPGQTRQEG
ncbi:sugar phosphate isomerase/epimerase family protein [Leucobacter tenebrionis]|uniref:sugar phosphate isomerase/epimerase family protein n=1 Tax=Leucobacter tenebrionis TaxID=2873270 RepID=UPI001CA68335|nr:sugar phosphate isomerase/epimerase family protein [Leucobacter tenebrionis]QZY50912.1 sugar phosphate isomerase/epimerase [Leucobacter tenebrionis]